MANVLSSIVEATTRTPHAVKLDDMDDLYVHRPMGRPDILDMMDAKPQSAVRPEDAGKSGEQIEHDTLTRIRDALYRDQQA
ncbi:MAG: hypothetical protein AAFP98_02890 [Pseudomonadota bacterium]